MSMLFEPSRIKGMKMANRFVRSATWTGLAKEDGACTPRLIDIEVELAKGGVGLIVTGSAYFRPEGRLRPWQIGIHKEELLVGLRELTQAVHDHGSAVALQLNHAGLFADTKVTGQPGLAPSKLEGFPKNPHREMTVEEIQAVVKAFGQAARRVKEANFDAVQILAAHGYLLNQFLSPIFNKRTDAYGGPLENRARLLLESLRSIRANVGDDFPVLAKLTCQDFMEGGFTLNDSLAVGVLLQRGGIDAIELSGGMPLSGKLSQVRTRITSEEEEAYFRKEAKMFKEKLHFPLILVGGIRTFPLAEHLVQEGYADYISMCRPFIREPSLIKRWKSGDFRKATCISDNICYEPILKGEGIYCVVEENRRRKTA